MSVIKVHPTLGILCRDDGHVFHPGVNVKHRHIPGYWTPGCMNKLGYCTVAISGKRYKVHRLIAEAFIPNPENKPTVDHISRDPRDNRPENLRWATQKEQLHNQGRYIESRIKSGVPLEMEVHDFKKIRRRNYYRDHRYEILAQKHEYYVINRDTIIAKKRVKRARDKGVNDEN